MAEGNTSPPRASEQSDFSFLYSPTVGHVKEVVAEQETGTTGRKRVRNPDKWTKKHVKRPGLRKNSPRLQISDLSETDCCRKKCLQQFSPSHLSKVKDEFESMYYEEQNIYLNGILKQRETKKHVATQGKQTLLLVQKDTELEGHQLKIVVLHTSISSGMKKELI